MNVLTKRIVDKVSVSMVTGVITVDVKEVMIIQLESVWVSLL